MVERKDGAHGKPDFAYRGEQLMLTLQSDNHPVAPLSDLWVEVFVFDKANRRGGKPYTEHPKTGLPVRPANFCWIEFGVPLTCLCVRKDGEIVVFPVQTSLPAVAESEMTAEQKTRPMRFKTDGVMTPREDRKQVHPPDAETPDVQKPEKTIVSETRILPSAKKSVASPPEDKASVPSGMDRYMARFGDRSPARQLPERSARSSKKTSASPPGESVSARSLGEQLRKVSGD